MSVERVAWLFPGQGAQAVGMGKALAERYRDAANVFAEANAVLEQDLRALCWDGPQDELDRTVNAQPALLATSIAALRAARAAGLADDALVCAGHSLGEFSALVAAGAISLADGLRLVRRPGELMQRADASGGMAAVIGLDADSIAAATAGTAIVIANDNAPGQVVISGPIAALPGATIALKAAGARRVLPLRVSGAFHSPAMRAIAPELAASLRSLEWREPRCPVIANVDAEPHTAARDFIALLERQVSSPVRWVDVTRRAASLGATRFIEFGPGSVLTGLVKRILPGSRTANVNDVESLERTLATD